VTIPAYTVRDEHPRLLFRESDRVNLTARTNATGGWKTQWDAQCAGFVNQYRALPVQNLIVGTGTTTSSANNAIGKLAAMAFWGWIEESGRPSGGAKDWAIRAALWACNNYAGGVESSLREILMGLALVYDFLYADMTSAERTTIAGEIMQRAIAFNDGISQTDQIDGHTGINVTCSLLGLLAIHGNSFYQDEIPTALNTTLEFLLGVDAQSGRLNYPQLCLTDGHSEKGHWYIYPSFWTELFTLWSMSTATTWDGWTAHSAWVTKIWEELLWHSKGGTAPDLMGMGDMNRSSSVFQREMHWGIAMLAQRNASTEAGRMLQWLFAQWDALDPTVWGPARVFDVILLDRAAITELDPKDASPAVSTSRLFSPPGVYYGRKAKRGSSVPDWDPDEVATVRVSARSRYYSGHAHLDAGSMALSVRGDMVCLTPSGKYFTGQPSWFNGYCRTWMQSWSPLVYDPTETFYWQLPTRPKINDGGQHFRIYRDATEPARVYDPATAYKMQTDAGGEAWMRCRSFTKSEGTDYAFLCADLKDAYKRDFDDLPRCSILETRYLTIWPTADNGLYWPAVLYYARMRKRNSAWETRIPVHSANDFTQTSYGAYTTGYNGVGKLWIDLRNKADYSLTVQGPGTMSGDFGSTQFMAPWNTVNYPPIEDGSLKAEERQFLKRFSLYLQKTTQVEEEHYVALAMLSESGDAEPAATRAWVTDSAQPDWYGITLGTQTYLVHRTLPQCWVGSTAPDTTPPAEVTAFAVAARARSILATWTDPADADLEGLLVRIRTSAIT
jgi:hypothetical protein